MDLRQERSCHINWGYNGFVSLVLGCKQLEIVQILPDLKLPGQAESEPDLNLENIFFVFQSKMIVVFIMQFSICQMSKIESNYSLNGGFGRLQQ